MVTLNISRINFIPLPSRSGLHVRYLNLIRGKQIKQNY